ncbi:GNAT family N-acetyltransferase [Kutzneria albida]|uniref:N-acetyltransferase domain-containing protein n=1 Tax=Kutzneria albida DSM 43870 TaxID=1449976 RepID=W5VYP9_9PSEU|nr:GNAT family N-acetyltransferase [Kutzneria albida]AHH93677.1 hypothetical protein KALB_300 [Kutzneria albida DSM 43870]
MDPLSLSRPTAEQWRTWRELRLAALADAPRAFGAALAVESAYDERQWRERLRPDRGVPIIAWLGADPVGIIGCYRPQPEAVELVSMWVAPRARGRGVGDRLIAEVLSWAGPLPVGLWVVSDNLPARGLYERNGFRATGQTQPYRDEPGTTELRFIRSSGITSPAAGSARPGTAADRPAS